MSVGSKPQSKTARADRTGYRNDQKQNEIARTRSKPLKASGCTSPKACVPPVGTEVIETAIKPAVREMGIGCI